ncbi:hypothetical protein YC2023_082211 [Brassica napus]
MKVHPAYGFQDESPSSLWVPGQKSIQPPIYEESHPQAMSYRRILQYYMVESGQESMAEFNLEHLLGPTWWFFLTIQF